MLLFIIVGSVSAIDLNNANNDINLLNNNATIFSENLDVSGPDSIGEVNSNNGGENYSSNDGDIKQSVLSGNDTQSYYNDGTAFKVVLSDKDGNLLSNKSVIFNVNGNNYVRITDNEGIASIAINLNPGSYNIASFFNGTDDYQSSSANNTINVLSTISGYDIEKYYKNDTQYYATFIDADGNFLNDVGVTFNINGIFYERKTNAQGTARLNINLLPGDYILTAINPINGEMSSNKIIVLNTMYASDVVKFYKNDTQFYVHLVNGEGNPLANQNVDFNINGVFYTRTTNEEGTARLNINLNPGKYIISTINTINGEIYSNNIVVLPTITATDLNMRYKDGNKFTAHLLDDMGNPLAYSDVTFNINGVLYTRVSDNDGNASLNINLDTGEYIITATNYNGLSVSNKIKIDKSPAIIEASDAHVVAGIDREYAVTLFGLNNKTIPMADINFRYNGVDINGVTDENGEAKVIISNLYEGRYSLEYEFKGNSNYYPFKSSTTLVVSNPTNILAGNDLEMIYQDGSKFYVALTDLKSVPMVNETITFNLMDQSYDSITDANGVASLDIGLFPGTYEISYSYSDVDDIDYNEKSSTVFVSKIPVYLSSDDLIFSFGESKAFTAVLTDINNNPLEGMDVTFNIRGKSYTRTTNASGVASLNINLPVGYYDIKTSLDNPLYAANSISNHILVDGAIFIAYDVTVYLDLYRDYSVTVLDAYENPISNADIEFIYNGISQHARTDDEGIATISIGGLPKGEYPIVYKYAERNTAGSSYIFVSENVLYTKNKISNLAPYLSDSINCPVSNAEIVALAEKLTKGLTNPTDKARAIFNYVRDKISYDYYYDTYYGGLGTLHAGHGNCVDQAHLVVALYRASGLPARYVHGKCDFGDEVSGHVWSQVLIGDTWIVGDTINRRNSLGEVVNWNNYNYKLIAYYQSLPF
ncbi:transglutaminase domain-containing protein [Methanobrevibacter sp.]|uniref:transglutaminase domain-containing protein n=1 Tax=Methanobrevibacter sp. TaxID=66852 RepID=UPI00388DB11C